MKFNASVRKDVAKENRSRSAILTIVPREEWPRIEPNMVEVWLSRKFLVQVYREGPGIFRCSICRTTLNKSGQWEDGISWDELMEIKREIGRGEQYAVEVLPCDADIINVANMRHFWILPEKIVGWRRRGP